jgi:maleate isomerase
MNEWETLTKLRISEPKLGYRGEVGLIAPMAGMVREWEAVRPIGLRFNQTIIRLEGNEPEQLKAMEPQLGDAAKLLNGAHKMDLIMLLCTSGSFIGGAGYEEHLMKIMTEASGSRSLTVIAAAIDLFKELEVKSVALVGPYLKETFQAEVDFLKAKGIDVACIKGSDKGLGPISEYWEYDKQSYAVYKWVLDAAAEAPDTDLIFVTCMASPILMICNELEEATGKPVLSSQSIALYGILKALKIPDPIPAYGKILRRPRL